MISYWSGKSISIFQQQCGQSMFFVTDSPYNQPKYSPCAAWNPNAITFTNNVTIGSNPAVVLVNSNNAVYLTAQSLDLILVWMNGSNDPMRNISANLDKPYGMFVSIDGDIYAGSGNSSRQVSKWPWNTMNSVVVMNVSHKCWSLFIDFNDTLYCSINAAHKVLKLSLKGGGNTVETAAGNGINGSAAYMLSYPNGIFVDQTFNLYVADSWNHRIQLFQPGQLNGTAVAGIEAPGTISLDRPTGVVLDADGYLFIADYGKNRIVRSGPFGFQCLFGCTGIAGSTSDKLNKPQSLSFDSYGNLFVVDYGNSRVQKFLLMSNSCGKYMLISFLPPN